MNHDHGQPPANYDKAFAIGIALNLSYVVVEAVFGGLAHSLALVADAGHNLSDVLSLLLAPVASAKCNPRDATLMACAVHRFLPH